MNSLPRREWKVCKIALGSISDSETRKTRRKMSFGLKAYQQKREFYEGTRNA